MLTINLENILDHFETNTNRLSEELNESAETLRRFRLNMVTRYSKSIIEKICTHFKVNVDDLIVIEGQTKNTFATLSLEEDEKFILRCKLKSLLAGRDLSIQQTASDIDESFETVRRMANNMTERIPVQMIEKLLKYFDIPLNELYYLQKVKIKPNTVREIPTAYTTKTRIFTNLNVLLNKKKLTLKQVSLDTDISYQMLLKFQNNQMRRLPLDMLETLCDYLDVPIDHLLITEKSNKK
ncbi:helix-turn-helix domain-containing protein [Anaerobacillus isosaccharinicus]|uniref:Helix-turn-helix domain-containing protein n=1 Tax=Anaerobacillus isosaccharinicus TaxID=1532552 RepID=A0A1S2L3F0_9BACI|nr:helix-turn-helix transcriptional regulator [Anaerobacillus isosaccharinicus]QOY37636.1 helix-turn-helix domain-containing protein [Anaerobacillus isosaccharinicus]